MSHFAVLAFVPETKTLEEVMAPYHEFECTGDDNEFVQDIDVTEEYTRKFNEDLKKVYVLPDGTYKSIWDTDLYRDPTNEELKEIGRGTGSNGKQSWTSQDWNDGKGYRTKIRYTPDFPVKEITLKEFYGDFKSFLIKYDGYEENKIISNISEINKEIHKYGYVIESNGTYKIIKRTNPNSKWDWYSVGGRWRNYFAVDQGNPAEFQFEAKRIEIVEENKVESDNLIKLLESGKINPEQFKNSLSNFNPWKGLTWAFIDENGNWNERGKMGWWALSANENANEYDGENGAWWSWVRQLSQTNQIYLVDCHI